MVETPWGDSEQLRERRLRPVRGTPPDEVERNQRERLFGALVASCAEKGYAGTTVADLVELSGVSSRSFYALFGDRHNLARAALEDILDRLQGPLSTPTEPIDEERSRERFERFAAAVAEQPATAKFVLSEAFGAGPEVVAVLERAIARFEEEARKRYEATASLAGVPGQVITARLGGILELARARLRAGREADLVGLGPEIVAMAMADRAPPQSLRFGVRPKRGVQESLEVTDHAERAMRAFAVDGRRAGLRGNQGRGCGQAGRDVGPDLLRRLLRQRGPDGQRDRECVLPGDRGHDARLLPSCRVAAGRAGGIRGAVQFPRLASGAGERCSPSASTRPATRRSKRGSAASPRSPR